MKKEVLFGIIMAFFVVLSLSNPESRCTNEERGADASQIIRILIDESSKDYSISKENQEYHIKEYGWPEDTDFSYSFDNNERWGYGIVASKLKEIASIHVNKSGKLTYSKLKDYDVLIIASFTEPYGSDEISAIKKFVENGGGLLLLGNRLYPNNSVSGVFDVSFEEEDFVISHQVAAEDYNKYDFFLLKETENGSIYAFTLKAYYFCVEDIQKHPITVGIEKLSLYEGIPITSFEKGDVLIQTDSDTWEDTRSKVFSASRQEWYLNPGKKDKDGEEGPFDILLALDDVGKGRAVFFGGSFSFLNFITEKDQENVQLIFNAVKWLGEPGGPYEQCKSLVAYAQDEFSLAKSLFAGGEFSQAKAKFVEAISFFEESIEMYPNAETNRTISEAESYIQRCNTATEAELLLEEASRLFENKEFEKAIEEFGKAKSLYEKIEYIEGIQECVDGIDKSNQWISLREEAISLFQQGEETLNIAQSGLDSTTYQDAKSLFERAKEKWAEYDDLAQVIACEEKIQLCNEKISDIERSRIQISTLIIGMAIAAIAIVYLKKSKRARVDRAEIETKKLSGKELEELRRKLDEDYVEDTISREEYMRRKNELDGL